MPKLAANLTMLFQDVPFLDRFAAAKQAGFQKDDVLVEVAGSTARETESALIGRLLGQHRPGDTVRAVVLRGGGCPWRGFRNRPLTTMAPTGTSPMASASLANCKASRMNCSSSKPCIPKYGKGADGPCQSRRGRQCNATSWFRVRRSQ